MVYSSTVIQIMHGSAYLTILPVPCILVSLMWSVLHGGSSMMMIIAQILLSQG